MANVMASMKIFPSDISVDLKLLRTQIQEALPAGVTIHRFQEEPIAFGLVALIAQLIFPEEEGEKMERIEESLKNLKTVGEIQTLAVTRI